MPKTRQQKEQAVLDITDKLSRAKSVVFVDYKGMTMSQLSNLRKKIREVNAQFTITKNTLLARALPKLPFKGPTATLFSYDDEITPIKLLVKALKDNAIGIIKAGFLGQEALDADKINKLAALPSKDELRGQTVGVLVAPLTGIVSVLQGNLRNLVYALSQVQKMKGGDAQASS